MAFNPYTNIPSDICDGTDLPDFQAIQDCASYNQLRSEVCGLFIIPDGVSISTLIFNLISYWRGLVDNSDPDKVHYLSGIGGFLPAEKSVVSLAGGRVEENRERKQRLTFTVTNMDLDHIYFAKQLQRNKKDFRFVLYTVGGRLIGSKRGLRPTFVDADIQFASGGDSRESFTLIMDTEVLELPI